MSEEKAARETGTRAEEILTRLGELVRKLQGVNEEGLSLSRLVTGDVPKEDTDGNEKREEPSNFLSALESLLEDAEFYARRVDRNVDFVKEQVAVSGFATPTKGN